MGDPTRWPFRGGRMAADTGYFNIRSMSRKIRAMKNWPFRRVAAIQGWPLGEVSLYISVHWQPQC